MSHLEEIPKLEIFPLQLKGDTLVISPRGDAAGFSNSLFQIEHENLLQLLEQPHIKHLIIDFGNSKYFGSEMIGAVNELVTKVRDQGGKTGICNLSVDMQEGIHVMQLDKHWRLYDTYKEASQEIVTEPIGQKIGQQVKANQRRLMSVSISLLALVVILTGWSLYSRNENRRHYNTLMSVSTEMDQVRADMISKREKNTATRRGMENTVSIVTSLEKKGGKISSGEKNLLAAAERLEAMLASMLPLDDPYYQKKKVREQSKKKKKSSNDPTPFENLQHQPYDELKKQFLTEMHEAYENFGWDQNEDDNKDITDSADKTVKNEKSNDKDKTVEKNQKEETEKK